MARCIGPSQKEVLKLIETRKRINTTEISKELYFKELYSIEFNNDSYLKRIGVAWAYKVCARLEKRGLIVGEKIRRGLPMIWRLKK